MVDKADAVADPTVRSDQILVAMEAGRDRELLVNWLQTFPQYAVRTVTDEIPETYDLCLLDPASLARHRSAIQQRVKQGAPMYLPHVLLMTERPNNPPPDEEEDQLLAAEPALDDVLSLPMEKEVLGQRIENLLRARRSSVQLSTREQQYQTLLQVLPEMVLLVEDGAVVYANDAATDTLTDRDTLEDRELAEFVAGDSQELLESVLTAATTATTDPATEFVNLRMTPAEGEELYVAATGLTVTFEGDPVTQLILRDLTAKKQRKQQLNLFRRAIEATVQGVTIADAQQEDLPLVYANSAFEEITGYRIDEALGRNCRFLQGPSTDEAAVRQLREGINDEQPVSVEILNYRKDGAAFWNRVDIVPIEDSSGTVTHFLGLQQDITQSKQSKQRLSVLNRILRHNLRNKMNVIQAYTERIENEETPPADALESIQEAADDLLAVGERAREFGSVITPSEHELESIDLAAVVEQNVMGIETEASEADITLRIDSRPAVSAHPGLGGALGDLFTQLAAPDQPTATVVVRDEGQTALLRVTDRAGALSAQDLEIVGHDVETPTEHLQGVGLWLVRWAVERSRGEMLVTTDEEHPTIEFRFPTDSEA